MTAVASVGSLVQGRMAAQEASGQNSGAGEAETAFSMAVGEAAAQGGLKEAADAPAEGESEENGRKKLESSLDLSSISVLLLHGAYHLQQVADAQAGEDHLLYGGRQMAEEALSVNGPAGGAVLGPAPEEMMRGADVSGDLAASHTEESSNVAGMAMADAGMAVPEPISETAKGMDGLEQADLQDIQELQAKSAPSAAQSVGIDSAREALSLSNDVTSGQLEAAQGPSALKADKEKEKPLQLSALAMAAAHRTEQAMHTESMQSTPEMTPENAAREENVAMQVARSSVLALRRGMAEYRVRLSPEGLGEVEVTVVAKGKEVSLSLRTDNEVARGLILDHADELRAELDKQNYQVNGLSVEVGTDSGNGGGFFASGDHAAPMFEMGQHRISGQDAAAIPAVNGQQADPRMIMPRSSTITYRV